MFLLFLLLLYWHLLVGIEIEILSLPYDRNEEPTCVLVMRQHSEALSQLFPCLFLIERGEHGLFETSLAHIVDRYVRKVGKFMKIVIFGCFFEFFSHNSPLRHPLSEFESGEWNLFQLNTPGKLLQSTGDYGFILNGVQRASRVGDLTSHFQKLEALE